MKEKVIRIIFIIIFFVMHHVAYTQKVDKGEATFLIKLTLFQESSGTKYYKSNEKALINFLKLEFQIDTLKEKGFNNFIFLKISPVFRNPQNIFFEDGPFLPDNCTEYIVAIHEKGRTIYRLKGFARNDFSSLLYSLKESGYSNINSLRQFVSNYSVESLNLGCLYQTFKNYNFNKKEHPCLYDCGEMKVNH